MTGATRETFKNVGARVGEPLVTISDRMSITFNTSFTRQAEEAAKSTHVLLNYSKKNNAVVLDFISEKAKGAIKMFKRQNILIS